MAKLIFKAADVKRVVEHALSASAWQPKVLDYDKDFKAITEPGKAAVILVHDSGVYLMSNGVPGDMIVKPGKTTESHFVAYANTCDPIVDGDECWDNSRYLVGGDDFAETLEWADAVKELLDKGATHIIINFGKTKLSLSARTR